MRKLLQHRRRVAAPIRPQDDIALSCRIRLARNLEGFRFPDWNDAAGHAGVIDAIAGAVRQAGRLQSLVVTGSDDTTEAMEALHERHIVSQDLLDRGLGGALIQCAEPGLSIMLNEEDHLRIQVIRPGMDLLSAWAMADTLDTQIESTLHFAFSPQWGYLTACPSNVGTGLRASVMVHLLGLRLTEELESVLRAVDALSVTVRGVYGEGTEAAGHLFQISNQGTLGQSEKQVIESLLLQVNEVIRQEHFARLRLLRDSPILLHDCVARALALLKHARMIPSDEAMDYLSALRLGVRLNLLRNLSIAKLDDLMLTIEPIHLQARLRVNTPNPEERDVLRADWLRQELDAVVFSPLRSPTP